MKTSATDLRQPMKLGDDMTHDSKTDAGLRYVKTLEDLVQCLIDNDPDEPIADNGATVIDQWRKDAERALRAAPARCDADGELQPYLDGKAIQNNGRVHLDISFNELKKLRAALRTWNEVPTQCDADTDKLWELFYAAFWASMKEYSGTEPMSAARAGFNAVMTALASPPMEMREALVTRTINNLRDWMDRPGYAADHVADVIVNDILAAINPNTRTTK